MQVLRMENLSENCERPTCCYCLYIQTTVTEVLKVILTAAVRIAIPTATCWGWGAGGGAASASHHVKNFQSSLIFQSERRDSTSFYTMSILTEDLRAQRG